MIDNLVYIQGSSSVLIPKSVTENGTYYASSDEADGYSSVAVDVQPNLGTKSISDNGTYSASSDELDGYSSVTVDVQPDLDGKTVTDNGTYYANDDNLDGYSQVTVSVQPNVDTKSISTNGTYTASTENLDGYSSVTVSVQPNVDTKSITTNGTYNASSDNLDGYSSVAVNVPMKDLDKINLTQAEYDLLSQAQKEDATKIYFIIGTGYMYYMDIRYNGVFPIEIESDNTLITTSTQSVTLEKGYHYLMTTIYSGGAFGNATIEGGAARVFNTDGYDRTIYIISTSATNVTYSRSGSLDSNKFVKFRIKQNGEYVDDLMFTNTPQSAWSMSQSPTITVEKGSYYMITYKASAAPNITNATPVCYAYIGETDAKKSISMIIKANENSITINDYNTNYSYFYYQKLIY